MTAILVETTAGSQAKATAAQVAAQAHSDAADAAIDAGVVHKATTETITGDKNFSGALTRSGVSVETVTGSQSKVDAAIAALVNAAPGTLDTLAEIANALANDPNLSATLTALIATKAADVAVVHNTGNEVVAGVKTFSSTPVVPDGSFGVAKLAFDPATQVELDAEAAARTTADTNHAAATTGVHGVGASNVESTTGSQAKATAAQAAAQAYADIQIAALVASSPAALDTLNELATALGDDPNFATTVTNALAAKATVLALTGETNTRIANDAATLVSAQSYADTAAMVNAVIFGG